MARIGSVKSDLGGVFERCSAREVERVRRQGVEVTVAPGTVIHAAADRPRWVYIVLSGAAVALEGGGRRRLGAGDVFGARELLSGGRRPGSLTCAAEATVLTLSARDFVALLDACAGFAHGVARSLAVRPALPPCYEGSSSSGRPRRRSSEITLAAARTSSSSTYSSTAWASATSPGPYRTAGMPASLVKKRRSEP